MIKRNRDAHNKTDKVLGVELILMDNYVHVHFITVTGERYCAPLPADVARDAFTTLLDKMAIEAEGRPT